MGGDDGVTRHLRHSGFLLHLRDAASRGAAHPHLRRRFWMRRRSFRSFLHATRRLFEVEYSLLSSLLYITVCVGLYVGPFVHHLFLKKDKDFK